MDKNKAFKKDDHKHQDMNKTFFLKQEDHTPKWHLFDATDKVVGRLATDIAVLLRGKQDPSYTSHTDSGDYVVVINVEKLVFTGDKLTDKEYVWYTGWRSGQKRASPREKMARNAEFVLQHAVDGMLPDNKLARQQIRRLKIYPGSEHPHKAQIAS